MFLHRRRARVGPGGEPHFVGALDLRAPEDLFSNDDAVQTRHRLPVRSSEVEASMASLAKAWDAGDETFARSAATDLVDRTRAHFQQQGIPVFSHPVVPPQFAEAKAREIGALPPSAREQALSNILASFEHSARPGVHRQFASLLSEGEAAFRDDADEPDPRRSPSEVPLSAERPSQQAAPEEKKPREDYAPFESDSQSESITSAEGVRADETRERFGDYNRGNVEQVVDDAIANSSWFERVSGQAGTKVRRKGRYIWTRYGWVDLQHVVSAATSFDNPALNLLGGLAFEGGQLAAGFWNNKYWSSFMKKEDLLSNWIGARALWHQKRSGGTIGYWVARILKEFKAVSLKEAAKHIANGGKADDWPYDLLGF